MLVDKLAPKLLEDNPLWLVVLCDLMTNLMLFFLVLFSFSQMEDQEKQKKMKEFIEGATQKRAQESPAQKRAQAVVAKFQEQEVLDEVERMLSERNIEAGLQVSETEIKIEMPDPALFAPGSADLSRASRKNLRDITHVLARLPDVMIAVEGHTDDRPVSSHSGYFSNWHLSAARANSVVEYLVASGIPANRLVAGGYGEFKPVSSNDTASGRARNRRIEIHVFKRTASVVESAP